MTKKKATKVISKVREQKYRLRPDDIQYIIELAQEHPRWSVDRIFNKALRPRVRTSVIVPLTPRLEAGLKRACKTYQLGIADVLYHCIQEWLTAKQCY